LVIPTPITNARSKWLYGYQSGFTWQPVQIATWKLAAALYDYRRIEGVPDPTIFSTQYDLTAAPFRQRDDARTSQASKSRRSSQKYRFQSFFRKLATQNFLGEFDLTARRAF